MRAQSPLPWFSAGDLNASFGLALDNVTTLVLMTSLLLGFGIPVEFIFTRMLPGTALGVMIGDLVYTWMAFRLARRTGRTDVTAMPLGLDTPSTIGIALAVLGPVYKSSGSLEVTWQVGMATMMFMGVTKLVFSFLGDWIRRVVPQAGLLGSIAGVGVALLGVLPLLKVFEMPIVGLVSLGIVLYALVARARLPGNVPGAAAAVLAGTLLYFLLGSLGAVEGFRPPEVTFALTLPLPTLGFLDGLGRAVDYLPLAIPFALLTIVGGINVNESARVAGDEYRTRDILLTEAVATLAAGLCGGVAQSTPYIGHPAYKAMGGRAAYTLLAGLFVGLGGAFGLLSTIVNLVPEAAAAPILLFVGLEIIGQTFSACPKAHYPAIGLAMMPSVANAVMIQWNQILGVVGTVPEALARQRPVVLALGNGFILTAMLWGAFAAHLADRKLKAAAVFFGLCSLLSVCGAIHSVDPFNRLGLPASFSALPAQIGLGYGAVALLLLLLNAVERPEEGRGQ